MGVYDRIPWKEKPPFKFHISAETVDAVLRLFRIFVEVSAGFFHCCSLFCDLYLATNADDQNALVSFCTVD